MEKNTVTRAAFLAVCATLLGTTAWAQTTPAQTAGSSASLPTVYLIGDSTVKNGTKGQQGWGDPFALLVDPARAHVVNRARGGRSSRTYYTEGLWAAVEKELKPGDVVMMQFGHNDGGPLDRAPYRASIKGDGDQTEEWTDPRPENKGAKETVHTYGWYLSQYIKGAKAKGATVVVFSLVPRNIWQEKDGKATLGRASNDYGKWAKSVAERDGATFIDLNDIVARRYETEGKDAVAARYFGATDHTHTTPEGARVTAGCVADALKAAKVAPVADWFLPVASVTH